MEDSPTLGTSTNIIYWLRNQFTNALRHPGGLGDNISENKATILVGA